MTMRLLGGILRAMVLFSFCLACVPSCVQAQEVHSAKPQAATKAKDRSSSNAAPPEAPEASRAANETDGSTLGLLRRFGSDQKEIWTSPARLRFSDTEGLVPLRGMPAGPLVARLCF